MWVAKMPKLPIFLKCVTFIMFYIWPRHHESRQNARLEVRKTLVPIQPPLPAWDPKKFLSHFEYPVSVGSLQTYPRSHNHRKSLPAWESLRPFIQCSMRDIADLELKMNCSVICSFSFANIQVVAYSHSLLQSAVTFDWDILLGCVFNL